MPLITTTSEDVMNYECMVLLPMDVSDKEIKEQLAAIADIFQEKGGKLLHTDNWGKRGLAYKIKGRPEGQYIVYIYELKPQAIREVDTALRLEKNILRHLLIKLPEKYEAVSYAERFATWLKERDRHEEEAKKEQEEEIKRRIVKSVAVKQPADQTKKKTSSTKKDDVDLDTKIDKLISDDDLNL